MGLVRAALSVLIVAGLANIGVRLARRFLRREPDADELAAGYILAVAAVGATAHALALAHYASPAILRIIAWGPGTAGALHLPALASSASGVSTQKFQLLPAAATTLALILVLKHFAELDAAHMALAFGAVAFAIGSKYPFIFSGTVVFAIGLWAAHRAGRLAAALAIGSFALVIIAAPVYLRNWSFYGDPLSPFLERFRVHPDPVIVAFAEAQRQPDAGPNALASLMLLPVGFIVPLQIGALSQPLGVGVLFVFAVTLSRGVARRLIAAAGAVTALGLLLGQLSPRFFLEPYLWCGAAAIASGARFRSLHTLLVAQAAVVAAAAVLLAATLAPALFSERLRDRVMTTMAAGYAESRWIDTIVRRLRRVAFHGEDNGFCPRRDLSERPRPDSHVASFHAGEPKTATLTHLQAGRIPQRSGSWIAGLSGRPSG